MKWYEKLFNTLSSVIKKTMKCLNSFFKQFFKIFNTANKLGMILSILSIATIVIMSGVAFTQQLLLFVFFALFIIFFINISKEK